MVAVVSGSGLGLFNSSTSTLGGAGTDGNSQVGRGRDRVVVNSTTGNLIVQSVDDTLSALGLDFAGVRTYNSQGLTDEDNNDQWRLGVHQRVHLLTGTVNTTGSTITKVFGDGASVVYTWNATRSRYESGEGDGANDWLTWNPGNSRWTWTDGSSRASEEYETISGVHRLRFSRDVDGNTITYNYTGSLLTSLNMAGSTAQTVEFVHSGNNLTSIRVTSNGVVQTVTRYRYDTSNRLQQVIVDLTPAVDGATTTDVNGDNILEGVTGQSYVTTYTYENGSRRIQTITQTDGSSVSFQYQLINGEYRVWTVTDAEGRVNTFTYSNVTGGGGGQVSPPANTAVLSNQDTVNLPRIDSALTTNAVDNTPYSRINGALSTTEIQNILHNRNNGALTTPPGGAGWSTAALFETSSTAVNDPQIAFDANGDGFVVWREGNNVQYRRYEGYPTKSWGSVGTLNAGSGTGAVSQLAMAMDYWGNTIFAWVQSDGVAASVYACRYALDTGYTSPVLVEYLSTAASTTYGNLAVAVRDGRSAIVWTQVGENKSLYYSEMTDGWVSTSATLLENLTNAVTKPTVSIGNAGPVVTWRQSDGGVESLYGNFYQDWAGMWWGATPLESSSTAISDPIGRSDADGNSWVAWRTGGDVIVRQMVNGVLQDPIVLDSRSDTVTSIAFDLDPYTAMGMVAWTQSNGTATSVYASTFNGAVWSAPVLIETSNNVVATGDNTLSVSMTYPGGAVAWLQSNGSTNDLVTARFDGTSWSAATVVDSAADAASQPVIAMDRRYENNVPTVAWLQTSGGVQSLFYSTYSASGGSGTPYYTVPSGATWQSIANAVYGVNSAAAGTALQSALGNPTLTTGAQLTGFPAQLSVPTTVTVPAYLTIPSGATWQSIANTVYGVNSAAAGTALQTAMSNPPLTAGNRLTNFPATLNVPTPVAAHYAVPSGATWQSIANALYGSSANNTAGANALQSALGNPSIAAGQRLFNIPATLPVLTTVPYYYTVQSGNTWSTIVQSIYGTTDANAITAFQTAVGTSTLTVGARLTVPMNLTHTPVGGGGGPQVYQTTTVQDALGILTTYTKDAQGRLLTSTRAGRTLVYTYDPTTGNVATITEDPTGLSRVTTFTYWPENGLLRLTRDSAGNTVERTYDGNNQLLTETRYTTPDPDGAGSGLPSGALVTRYVYDGNSHLRFVISADGRVTEHQYNGSGQRTLTFNHLVAKYTATPFALTDLTTWAGGTGAGVRERIDYRYDWRGNIDRITRWATTDAVGAGTNTSSLTQFVYDQRGQLLQTIDPRGSATAPNVTTPNNQQAYATTYTYDGLGRLLGTVEWLAAASGGNPLRTRATLNSYGDSMRQTTVTLAHGLVSVSTFNRAGELISTNNGSLGVTEYKYDANGRLRVVRDPTLVRQFSFYDDANRLVGTVDGDGTVTEIIYDNTDRLIKTVRHSSLLSATTLASLVDASGNPTAVTFGSLRTEVGIADATDQVTRNVYDGAGRLVYTIDALGVVTKLSYDGANRLVSQRQYNNTVTIARATDQVLPNAISVSEHADDRLTRHFYDNAGNRIATLDGAGHLTEYTYDNANHLITEFARANPVAAGVRAAGTLSDLQTSAGTDMVVGTEDDFEVDVYTHYYYDQQGRQIGELDGEGYFTRTAYDVAGNPTTITRYDVQVANATRPTLDAINTAVGGAPTRVTLREYDGAGRVAREINHEGTPTDYEYDHADNVLSVRTAAGDATDERWISTRFDALGRVIRELTAEGRVALAALGSSPTQTAIDGVWDQWGIVYTYDNGGRRTTATHRPNSTQTNVTRYFYDNDSRLRFEVNQLGERKEYRYNALGQLTDEIAYYDRISTSGLANGGLLTSTLTTTLTASPNSTYDTRTQHTYTLRGERWTSTTVQGANVERLYNSFGDLRSERSGTGFAATTYTYTARGQLYQTFRGGTLFETREYDAFGNLWRITDGRGLVTRTIYDRINRGKTTIDALSGRSSVSYDGFSRTTRTDDATTGTNETIYNYSDTNRTMTVDTPEGVRIVTTHNRHGQVSNVKVSLTATPNTIIDEKSFTYDKNGNLRYSYEDGVQIEERTYDRGGRLETVVNARNVTTRITYDAANRVFTKVVDSTGGGLALTTTYAYDGIGRIYEVTDERNALTRTLYDRDGRVSDVIVDPNGLNLRTHYDYDTRNNITVVTENYGTQLQMRTQYVFDTLGRRSEEIVDPTSLGGTLNIRTQYKYDNNDNVTRKIDNRNFSTWYVYDANDRLTHEIDALGGVTLTTYDAVGRIASTRRYVTPIASLATLQTRDVPALADFVMPATATNDRFVRSYYDRDGREIYSIDGRGIVTQRTYDALGNVTRERVLALARLTGTYADTAAVTSTLGSAATTLNIADRVTWFAYDGRGRVEFSVDSIDGSVGAVQRAYYDANGNVIETRKYLATRALNLATDITTLRNWGSANSDAAVDQFTRMWYDNADRARFTLDAEGFLVETKYNDSTRATTTIAYNRLQTGVRALGSGSSAADVNGAILTESGRDQIRYDWVDAAGRSRYTLDAEGYLSETRYNDSTGATYTIDYARAITATLNASSDLVAVGGAIVTTTRDRTTMNWVDAAGRERFTMDGEGFLVETRYNNTSGSRSVIRYTVPVYEANAAVHRPTLTSRLDQVEGTASGLTDGTQQVTKQDLDNVGRVNKVTSADGSVDQIIEYYEYNAAGDKVKFTNAKATASGQAAYTWDYTYDANGRVLTETTPLVDVYSVTASTTDLTVGAPSNQRIVTRMEYDFLGNVSHRYEASGVVGQERLTRYEYDALGRQLRTFHPAVFLYNPAGDTSPWGIGGTLVRTDTPSAQILTSEVWYDALGNAFRSRDVNGNFSYKTYDRIGRVQLEVSPKVQGNAEAWNKNYVTRHEYDAFGNETKLTRYATGLATQPSNTVAFLRTSDITITTSGDDRVMDMGYDRRNLKTSVTLASVTNNFIRQRNTTAGSAFDGPGVTSMEYNAFGEVILSRQRLSTSSDLADTYSYYNLRGEKIAQIDPEKYLTTYRYDESGDLIRQTEFARAITGSIDTITYTPPVETPWTLGVGAAGTEGGFDRTISFGYDRLNRKRSQNEVRIETYSLSNGALSAPQFVEAIAYFDYDVLGNQVRVQDASGNLTYMYYDGLGRTIAIVEATRNLGDGTRPLNTDINLTGGTTHTPATRFFHDIHGNVVQQTQYATSVGTPPTDFSLPTFTSHANDRITRMQYDAHGKLIRTEDPMGADRYASYGSNGVVAKEWQIVNNTEVGVSDSLVTIHKYDALGNEIETQTPVTHIGSTVVRTSRTVFNAFGEAATRGIVNALNADGTTNANGTQEFFHYDTAGRVWRTNSGDGVTKIFLYDAAGRVTVEFRSQTVNLATYANLQAFLTAYNANTGAYMRTETVYDKKGNVLERYTPTYTIRSGTLPQAVNDLQTGYVPGSASPTSVYMHWAGQLLTGVDELFYYRLENGTTWIPGPAIEQLPDNRMGVNIHALRGQNYEYLVTYRRTSQPSSFAETIGTFRVDVPILTNHENISRNNLQEYESVAPLQIVVPPTGTVSGTRMAYATYASPTGGSAPGGNPPRWFGGNAVMINWSSTGGQTVQIELQYNALSRDGVSNAGAAPVRYWTTSAATQDVISWTENDPTSASGGNEQALQGGIHSVHRVLIWTLDANGNRQTVIRDSRPDLSLKGVVWDAPMDTGVTAVLRYKPIGNANYAAGDYIDATRIGNQWVGYDFTANVFDRLTTAGTYDYRIEYWRAGVEVARKEGRLTSNGGTLGVGGSVIPSTQDFFDDPVAPASIYTVGGLFLQWMPPAAAVDATFEFGTTTAYGQTRSINTSGSPWSVDVASLAPPLGGSTIQYAYRIIYKQGGRTVSTQTGTFNLNPPTQVVSWTATPAPGNEPGATEAVNPVTGTSSVLNASSARMSTATYSSPPGGSAPGGNPPRWWGGNAILVNWISTGGQTVRVIMDWDSTFRGGGRGPAGVQRSVVTNAASQVAFSWSESDPGAASGGNDQASIGGVWGATRIQVWSVDANGNNVALLRDSQSSATTPGPVGMTWQAPNDSTLTYRFFYYVNGNPVEVIPSRSGNTLSVNLAGLAAGSYNFKIAHYKAGMTTESANRTGTFTTDGTTVTVNSQNPLNLDPTWTQMVPSGSTILWNRALMSGQSMTFEYWNGSAWVPKSFTTQNNITFVADFTNFGVGTWQFRFRHYDMFGQLSALWNGDITVGSSTVNNPAGGLTISRNDVVDATDPIPIANPTTLTDRFFRWSFPKLDTTNDRVRFSYTVNGNTHTQVVSGSGPSFAVDMTQLPIGSSTFTWWISYDRPQLGESNPYAYASGSGSATLTPVAPSQITLVSEANVWPSPQLIAHPTNAGNGFIGWTTNAEAGATVRFIYWTLPSGGETPITSGFQAHTPSGLKIDLSFLGGGSYGYRIEYQRSGQSSPYAKAIGQFTVAKSEGTATYAATRGAARPEPVQMISPQIGTHPHTYPPEAFWMRRDWTTPPTFIPGFEAPQPNGYGGGFIQTAPRSTAFPNGQYSQNYDISQWRVFGAQTFYWQANASLDTDIQFFYRAADTQDTFTEIDVWRLIGMENVGVNIDSLTPRQYEYRVTYTRTGAGSPYSTVTGRFTRTADNLNQTVSVNPATAAQDVTAAPVLKQIVDRWGNAIVVQDAAGGVTDYRYDQRNQLVQVTAPVVKYLDTRTTFTDTETSARPTTYTYYDKQGNKIATRDGNGNLMRYYYNAAGQLVTTQNADSESHIGGAFLRNTYNAFGEVVQVSDEWAQLHDNLGFKTRNVYDKAGRLTEVWREEFANTMPAAGAAAVSSLQLQYFGYDEAGRRIREANEYGQATRYAYDLTGNVRLKRMPSSTDTRYTYDAQGNKVREENDIQGGAYAFQTWTYDYFGRVRGHVGLTLVGGSSIHGIAAAVTRTYEYNFAGLMFRQLMNGAVHVEYDYDAAGQAIEIRDILVNRQTYNTYDIYGRRIREKVIVDGLIHQDSKTSYDALGRISTVEDPDYRLSYSYDLAGNRTYIRDEFVNHAATRTVDNLYFKYDAMNRVKMGQALLKGTSTARFVDFGGPIDPLQGYEHTYNARGDRTASVTIGQIWNQSGSNWAGLFVGKKTEQYVYDGLGRLTTVRQQTNSGFTTLRSYTFDEASRVTDEYNYFIEEQQIRSRWTHTDYDADSRASVQTTRKVTGNELENIVRFGTSGAGTSDWRGYDSAGNLRGYDVEYYDSGRQTPGTPRFTTKYRQTYYLGDAFLVKHESAESRNPNGSQGPLLDGHVERYYNANDELTKAVDQATATKSRGYVNNQQGQVLTSVQTTVGTAAQFNSAMDIAVAHSDPTPNNGAVKAQYYFFFNGMMLGSFGQLQPNSAGQFSGNFDTNYTPVSPEYPMQVPPSVASMKGDTLRIIAQRVYGDASLWYLLAEENGIGTPDSVIPEGTMIRVPNNVVSLANSANVYKPYDAAKAMGDLTPSQAQPPPPKEKGCGLFAMFLMMVVMLVVTVITFGAAAAFVGPAMTAVFGAGLGGAFATFVAASALSAAVGSIASQGVGIMMGVQDKINWKEVGMSALAAGVTAGLGGLGELAKAGVQMSKALTAIGKFANFIGPVGRAAVGNALTQGLAVATGLQSSFNWKAVAASAASALVAQGVGKALGSITSGPVGGVVTEAASRFAGGVVSAKIMGGKIEYGAIAVDVFGNMVGNAMGGAIVERLHLIDGSKGISGMLQGMWRKQLRELLNARAAEARASAQPTGMMFVHNGRGTEQEPDIDVSDIGLLPTYREKADALLDFAKILRTNDATALKELKDDFAQYGENSAIGGLMGALNIGEMFPIIGFKADSRQDFFGKITGTEQRRMEAASLAEGYATLMTGMADSLEGKIKAGALTDVDRAYLHGDITGLNDVQVAEVIKTWKRMSFITPSEAIAKEGGIKDFLYTAAHALDPSAKVSSMAIGGALAAWNTARNYSKFLDAIPKFVEDARKALTDPKIIGKDVLSVHGVQSAFEQVAELALRFERSAVRMAQQLGIKALGKFAKILPGPVKNWAQSKARSWQGGFNKYTDILTDGAVEMALTPLVEAGLYKSIENRYKHGNNKGIDKVLWTTDDKPIFLEIKGSGGGSGSFSRAQGRGAASYVPRAMRDVGKYAADPDVRDAAKDIVAQFKVPAPQGYGTPRGYGIVGLKLYSRPSQIEVEVRTWDKNVSSKKYTIL